jgi:hypothetical protein
VKWLNGGIAVGLLFRSFVHRLAVSDVLMDVSRNPFGIARFVVMRFVPSVRMRDMDGMTMRVRMNGDMRVRTVPVRGVLVWFSAFGMRLTLLIHLVHFRLLFLGRT